MADTTPPGARRAAACLARAYDRALLEHGDTTSGFLWPSAADVEMHYQVILDVIEPTAPRPLVLADLACGSGGLLAYLDEHGVEGIDYRGFDRSHAALAHAQAAHPAAEFRELDIAASHPDWEQLECDYLVANGLFTSKFDARYEDMWELLEWTVRSAWPHVRRGLALNVLSTVVDWRRDDLFHVPMDDLARLLHGLAGRGVRFRADYGLYTYTAYAYRGRDWRARGE